MIIYDKEKNTLNGKNLCQPLSFAKQPQPYMYIEQNLKKMDHNIFH